MNPGTILLLVIAGIVIIAMIINVFEKQIIALKAKRIRKKLEKKGEL